MIKGSLKAIVDGSNSYNIVSQVYWVSILAITIIVESGLVTSESYYGNEGLLWVTGLIAYIVGTTTPCREESGYNNGIGTPLFLSVFWLLQFSVAITVYCFRHVNFETSLFTPDHLVLFVTSFFAASSVAIGWFVHAYTQKKALRKQHTVNVLNSSRMSDAYQKKISERSAKYYHSSFIESDDVKLYKKSPAERKGLGDDDKETVKAIGATIYLLNYYEFICVGIKNNDMDSDYLYDTVSSIAEYLYKSSTELILELRKKEPRAYENLEAQLLKWKSQQTTTL